MWRHWFHWLRPKRRWFQYRLRTLFVLMTLVCVWLSYNAWRFQQEKAIVAGIIARDPQAVIVWAGPSWLQWLSEASVPTIFRRVHAITLKADIEIPAGLSELQLQKLSTLKALTLNIGTSLNGKANTLKQLLPETEVLYEWTVVGVWDQRIIDYLKNPTDAVPAEICGMMGPPWRFVYPPFSTNPDELRSSLSRSLTDPNVMVFEHRNTWSVLDDEEENLAGLLDCRHVDLRIVAARHLWGRHSRRHASEVMAFAAKLAANSDMARELKSVIEADLAPERILAELSKPVGDDTAWWAWLAAMRPHPSLVPILVQLVEKEDPLAEASYALRRARDAGGLALWLKVLAECEDKRVGCIAAYAIHAIGDPAAELQLIKALDRKDSLTRSSVCDALAKVGTTRCLPALREHVADKSDQDGFDVAGAARRAIEAIEDRSRSDRRITEAP
jgi:hypothetical protein